MKKKSALAQAQIIVLSIVVISYIVSIVQASIQIGALQATSVSDMSGWIAWFVVAQLMPVVSTGLMWFFTRGSGRERAYQAVLAAMTITLAVNCLWIVVSAIISSPQFFEWMVSTSWITVMNGVLVTLWVITASYIVLALRPLGSAQKIHEYLQRLFVYIVSAFVLVQFVQTAYFALLQLPYNQNFSSYRDILLFFGSVVIFFAPAYILARRAKEPRSYSLGVFVATLSLVAADTLSTPVTALFNIIQPSWLLAVCIALTIAAAVMLYKWLYNKLRVSFA